VLKFSATHPEVEATEHWQEFRFLIDGKVFDPNKVDQRVRLGAVEEWTIINEHKDDHVFHIHTNDMEVTNSSVAPSSNFAAVGERGAEHLLPVRRVSCLRSPAIASTD